jgi:hypothetical protein
VPGRCLPLEHLSFTARFSFRAGVRTPSSWLAQARRRSLCEGAGHAGAGPHFQFGTHRLARAFFLLDSAVRFASQVGEARHFSASSH